MPHVRLHLILTVLCCMTFWIGSIYISECTFNAVPWESLYENRYLLYALLDVLFYAVDALIIVLIGLPLLFGCAMIFEGAARGVREPMTTLFCAFDSPRRYRKTLGLMLWLLGAHLLTPVLCAILAWALYDSIGTVSLWVTLPVALITLLVASVILGRNDAVLALAYDDPSASVYEWFARSHRITKGKYLTLWQFKLSYIGWGLLSVLSLGLVLILHALPHFSLSYSLLLSTEAGDDTQS
jgi:hypothetical protein